MSERDRVILGLIANGAQTSRDLAGAIGSTRARIAVALWRLAELGFVELAVRETRDAPGRPCNRWRLTQSAISRC
jgi:predicted ArsR family transcriptional regulator